MNFKTWIEGIGFDTQKMSDRHTKALLNKFKNTKTQKAMGGSDDISQSDVEHGLMYYDEKDRLMDLVRLVPLDKIDKLPIIDVQERIPSFEGGQIYYAYSFTPSEKFQVLSKNKGRKTDELGVYADTTMGKRNAEFKRRLAFIEKRLQAISKAYNFGTVLEAKIPNLYYTFNMLINEFPILNAQAVRKASQMMGVNLSLVQLNGLRSWFDSYERDEWLKLTQEKKQVELEIRSTKGRRVLGDEDAKNFFKDACLAVAQIMKHPKTPEQQKIQQQFVQKAVEAFTTKMGNKVYDYVIWPESSSSLNEMIGMALANHYKAEPMRGFNKRSRDNTQLDVTTAMRQGHDQKSMLHHFNTRVKSGNLDTKPTIKGVSHSVVKPYVRMWDMEPLEKGKTYRKSRILIVDDTTNTGATMQSIHKLLIAKKPRSIDMFVPVHLSTYFRSSTVNAKIGINQNEETTMIGTGTPEPEDSGLSRSQTKPDKHFSNFAAQVFLSRDSDKRKAYKLKHQREIN